MTTDTWYWAKGQRGVYHLLQWTDRRANGARVRLRIFAK